MHTKNAESSLSSGCYGKAGVQSMSTHAKSWLAKHDDVATKHNTYYK